MHERMHDNVENNITYYKNQLYILKESQLMLNSFKKAIFNV